MLSNNLNKSTSKHFDLLPGLSGALENIFFFLFISGKTFTANNKYFPTNYIRKLFNNINFKIDAELFHHIDKTKTPQSPIEEIT